MVISLLDGFIPCAVSHGSYSLYINERHTISILSMVSFSRSLVEDKQDGALYQKIITTHESLTDHNSDNSAKHFC